MDARPAGGNIPAMQNLRTRLYDWHTSHSARIVGFGGWDMPVQYAGIAAEHKAVRTAAGAFDISHMARLDVTGPDALPLLEKVFTNSVAGMKPGQVRYGLVCNEAGGILDDILVYRWADGTFAAVVNAGNRPKIAAWLDTHKAGLDVTVTDHTFGTTMIAVQGPAAMGLCAGMFADDVSGLKYYFAMKTTYRNQPCVVSRTGYTGEDGLEISVPNDLGPTAWDDVIASGAVPCGLGARDTLRLEAAMPLYGHELSEQVNPIQAGLGWAVKLDKGDFLSRAALANVTPSTVRVGLQLDGSRAAREGSVVLAPDGTAAGTVTSGSFCPWVGKSVAMAYVPPALATVGTALAIDLRGTAVPAVVVPLPFYKRPKAG